MSFQASTQSSVPSSEAAPVQGSLLRDLVVSLRPRQWLKNSLLFMALIFSVNQYWSPGDLTSVTSFLSKSLTAFGLFCIMSSAGYLLNDLLDAPQDREHPVKRYRPIAAGRLSPTVVLATAGLLGLGGLAGSVVLSPSFGLVAAGYIVLTTAYSLGIKHQVLLDVCFLAMGFVLRAVAGAVAIGVPISPWLYVCTFLGALFLAIPKRRHEFILLEDKASSHRKALAEYSPALLDQMVNVVAPSTVIAYSLYTFSAESLPRNHAMMWTIPFVLYGIFRYLYLVYHEELGGSPEEALLGDVPLMADVFLWLVVSSTILLVFRGQ